jgi:hypothetical protein
LIKTYFWTIKFQPPCLFQLSHNPNIIRTENVECCDNFTNVSLTVWDITCDYNCPTHSPMDMNRKSIKNLFANHDGLSIFLWPCCGGQIVVHNSLSDICCWLLSLSNILIVFLRPRRRNNLVHKPAMSQEANRRDHELIILTRDSWAFCHCSNLVILQYRYCVNVDKDILKRRSILPTSYWKTLSWRPVLKLLYLVLFSIVSH